MRLIPLLAITILVSCGSNKNLEVPNDFQPQTDLNHIIGIDHLPEYKKIIVHAPISKVMEAIVATAKMEGFDDIRVDGQSIVVRGRIAIVGDEPVIKTEEAVAGAAVVFGILALTMGYGANFDFDAVDLSQPQTLSSIHGTALLRKVGNGTEIGLNFSKLTYNWEADELSAWERFNTSMTQWSYDPLDYRVISITEINDPEVYAYAFKRFQGLPAEMPTINYD